MRVAMVAAVPLGVIASSLVMWQSQNNSVAALWFGASAAMIAVPCAFGFMLLVKLIHLFLGGSINFWWLVVALNVLGAVWFLDLLTNAGEKFALVGAFFGPFCMFPTTITSQWVAFRLLWRREAQALLSTRA